MMTSAVTEHADRFGGRPPIMFVLHEPSAAALRNEVYRRFGDIERNARGEHTFGGVMIALCMCHEPRAFDYYLDANGERQPL
jgi:hypothetical protein